MARAVARSPAAWSTLPRSHAARPAHRWLISTAWWSASTRPGSPMASTSRCPHGRRAPRARGRPRARRVGAAPRARRGPGVGRGRRPAARLGRASPSEPGCSVRDVADGSPAADAGVKVGDLLVTAGGAPIGSVDDLHRAIDAARHRPRARAHPRPRHGRAAVTVTFPSDPGLGGRRSGGSEPQTVASSWASARRAAKRRPALPMRSMRFTSAARACSASGVSPSSSSMPQCRSTTGTRIWSWWTAKS